MAHTPGTKVDLARLALAHGEGRRLELPVPINPMELGGQRYEASPDTVPVRLEVSRPSGGHAFRLRFPVEVHGPCMRCLASASVAVEVDSREAHQELSDDEELRSPYVSDDGSILDLGHWVRDAAILALPTPLLCRPDCAGLPDAEEEQGPDPRWAKLDELKRAD